MVQPARGARSDEAVPARPDGEMRDGRLVSNPGERRLVHAVPGNLLVERPDGVLMGIAGEGRPKRDHRPHLVRVVARIFPREEPAEAPADEHDLTLVVQSLDALAEEVERVGPGAHVPSLLPAVHAIAGARELAPQREGRL